MTKPNSTRRSITLTAWLEHNRSETTLHEKQSAIIYNLPKHEPQAPMYINHGVTSNRPWNVCRLADKQGQQTTQIVLPIPCSRYFTWSQDKRCNALMYSTMHGQYDINSHQPPKIVSNRVTREFQLSTSRALRTEQYLKYKINRCYQWPWYCSAAR